MGEPCKGSDLPFHPVIYTVLLEFIKAMASLNSPLKIPSGLKELLGYYFGTWNQNNYSTDTPRMLFS